MVEVNSQNNGVLPNCKYNNIKRFIYNFYLVMLTIGLKTHMIVLILI